MQNTKNNTNIILAAVIALGFMVLWQFFYEIPNQKKQAAKQAEELNKPEILAKQEENTENRKKVEEITLPSEFVLSAGSSKRILFENAKIKGSFNPEGLKIDNLELKDYKESNGGNIQLLSPAGTAQTYFAQFGFTSSNSDLKMPHAKTLWNVDRKGEEFIASWQNGAGLTFFVKFKLDDNYMFDISQGVQNNSGLDISISPFVRIFRNEPQKMESTMISHEGFLGNFDNKFHELKYEKIKEVRRLFFSGQKETLWAGFSDKYWLTSFFYNNKACSEDKCSFIPADISFNYILEGGKDKFQADFTTEEIAVKSGKSAIFPSKFFAGAKELKLLDKYENQGFTENDKTYPFNHFDKTVDFGIFYFLTKPIFLLIQFLNSFIQNFGFSIILLTFIIKLILYPIAKKSYISMAKMKAIAPLIEEIRKTGADKMEVNRRVIGIYKERGVNPLSGCLPILLQIPVFFALYKVLYISIEMRGAEFIWWIKDLSMKDPTSIFNLFGMLPFDVPTFLQIGVLPILMGLTTYFQQSLSPKSGDATQAMIIKSMPFILIFVFASFPAGIVLYWITNNLLSILQQLYVEKIVLPRLKEKDFLLANSRK